jgi:hypothetical protein
MFVGLEVGFICDRALRWLQSKECYLMKLPSYLLALRFCQNPWLSLRHSPVLSHQDLQLSCTYIGFCGEVVSLTPNPHLEDQELPCV